MILHTNDSMSDLLLEKRLRGLRKAIVKQAWPTDSQILSSGAEPAVVSEKSAGNSALWDLAYSWGDHALAGYLTECCVTVSETQPGSPSEGDLWIELL